jgi:hypothetical protein
MASRTIYTRVYSDSSAGELSCGRTPRGNWLSGTEPLGEFILHSDKDNRVPTALVSVSVRIVDTLTRAFNKHHVDREPAGAIWIVFIEVPIHNTPDSCPMHSAKRLADQCKHPEARLFTYESFFEWAIPEEYVLHKVSPQTLINRGLTLEYLTKNDSHIQYLATEKLRGCIAKDLQTANGTNDFEDIGIYLAYFAKKLLDPELPSIGYAIDYSMIA